MRTEFLTHNIGESPQRRRRIYLVADFRGGCAEKILFEREGLRGYFEKSRTQRETVATDVEGSFGADDTQGECLIYTRAFGGKITPDGATPTLEARAGTGGNNQPIVAYTMQIRQGCDGGGKGALIQKDKSATLLARDYKDPTCVEFYDEKSRRYIVRRLTPTECARLQGFPDKWGHIESKTELTDEEYRWWLEVRKTHDAINGRTVKDYNEKQMLTWYNKLWTDSAEYKMWGNGIALPCALYVLQGIKESLDEEKLARSKWLDELLSL